MPRILFTPGDEALAADMQVMSDATVARFDSAAQRQVQWPVPYDGALSYLSDTDQLDLYRNDGLGGGAWHRVLSVAQNGAVDVADHLNETETDTRYLRRLARVYPPPGDFAGSRPTGTVAEVTTASGVGGFRVNQYADGDSTGRGVITVAGDRTSIAPGDMLNNPTGHFFAVDYTDTAAGGRPAMSFNLRINNVAAAYAWVCEDIANAGRAKLQVLGKIQADNVPYNLLDRLAAIEARMGIEPTAADSDLVEPVESVPMDGDPDGPA